MARRFRDRGGFDAAYDVPYTTVHTGVIRGGTALNIVPRDCSFDFEFRLLPLDDPDALLAEVKRFAATLVPEMHAVDPRDYIEFDELSATPGFDTPAASEISELGRRLSGARTSARFPSAAKPRCSTTRRSRGHHLRTGHIAQAHQPNEWIALEQLALWRPHAPARRSRLRDMSVAADRRRRRSGVATGRGGFSRPRAPCAGQQRHPLRLDVCGEARRARPGDAGADPRQRSLRRDRARLGSARRSCGRRAAPVDRVRTSTPWQLRSGRPFASRCIDEDFNRLWTAEVLDGQRDSSELRRARELRPLYDRTDFLLDIHSMSEPCLPLAMAGRRRRASRWRMRSACREHIVVDAGHAAGRRLRDFAFFDDEDDPRSALLIECGQHWEAAAPGSPARRRCAFCAISAWPRKPGSRANSTAPRCARSG